MLCLAYKSGVYKQFQSQMGTGFILAALCTDHPPPPKKKKKKKTVKNSLLYLKKT